jgi:hypothetical protein
MLEVLLPPSPETTWPLGALLREALLQDTLTTLPNKPTLDFCAGPALLPPGQPGAGQGTIGHG